jgi:hypothetical protein
LPVKATPPPPPPPRGAFADLSQWKQDGDYYVHTGSGIGFLTQQTGTLRVRVEKQTKKGLVKRVKKIEWVIDYHDDKDTISFTIDGNKLRRQQVTPSQSPNNKTSNIKDSGDYYDLQFDVTKDKVTIRDGSGNIIDEVDRALPALAPGRMGFRGDVSLIVKK